MAPTPPCDVATQRLRTVACWAREANAEDYLPESCHGFNSAVAATTKTSTVWGAAGLLSESISSCDFKINCDGRDWEEPVITPWP